MSVIPSQMLNIKQWITINSIDLLKVAKYINVDYASTTLKHITGISSEIIYMLQIVPYRNVKRSILKWHRNFRLVELFEKLRKAKRPQLPMNDTLTP